MLLMDKRVNQRYMYINAALILVMDTINQIFGIQSYKLAIVLSFKDLGLFFQLLIIQVHVQVHVFSYCLIVCVHLRAMVIPWYNHSMHL